jgi:hypothetical protein
MELFNKALFLSQQKILALTHRRVYTLMANLFQILNQFVLLFRKNVIEKSSMIWRVLPLVKINTRISETPCIILSTILHLQKTIDSGVQQRTDLVPLIFKFYFAILLAHAGHRRI